MSKKECSEGKNRRHPDADEDAVQSAVCVVASVEIDDDAQQETGERRDQQSALQDDFRFHKDNFCTITEEVPDCDHNCPALLPTCGESHSSVGSLGVYNQYLPLNSNQWFRPSVAEHNVHANVIARHKVYG